MTAKIYHHPHGDGPPHRLSLPDPNGSLYCRSDLKGRSLDGKRAQSFSHVFNSGVQIPSDSPLHTHFTEETTLCYVGGTRCHLCFCPRTRILNILLVAEITKVQETPETHWHRLGIFNNKNPGNWSLPKHDMGRR